MYEDRTRNLGGERRRSSSDARELTPGEQIGSWRVLGAIGGGGFGSVYEVSHVATEQHGALKLMHAHFVSSAEMLARFEREIEVLRRLEHPNIVKLIDVGFSADQRPFLCMELLTGDELSKIIAEKGALDAEHALAIFAPLCDAISLAHSQGIVHRDIKASNVVICRSPDSSSVGRVVLLDFGIAKLSDALGPELTASRQSLGTPSCMAPEQIHGQRVDQRTDVYAMGGLLFHMLTGRLPFQDSSATMVQYLHLHARRPNVSGLVAAPRRLDDVIACAMAIDPAERFHEVNALLAATRAAMRETAVTSVPTGEVPCVALLVTAAERSGSVQLDAALLDDLEAVLPTAERALITCGFRLAVDLGTTQLFVARADAVPDPIGIAISLFEQLQRRQRRHPRVRIGLGVHRDAATFVGADIQPGPLLRPAAWNLPEDLEGVWVTGKLDATAPTGHYVRS